MEDNEELYEIKEPKKLTKEEEAAFNKFQIVGKIFTIALVLFISYEMISLVIKTKSPLIMPFAACIILAALVSLARAFNKEILEKTFSKICILIFLLLWMGFVGFATYSVLKAGASLNWYLILSVFWIAGFYMIYKYLIKKN